MSTNIVKIQSLLRAAATGLNQRLQIASIHSTAIGRKIFKIQDEADFEKKVLQNDNLVILDFYATWCGPCKMLAPRLETIVGGRSTESTPIDLAKVDVDELDTVAGRYEVSSIPAIFAIKGGKIVDQFVGMRDDDQLDSFIDAALAKK